MTKSNLGLNKGREIAKHVIIFSLFLIVWYFIFRYSGSFTQGYDIYEHNLIVTTCNDLNENPFAVVLSNSIAKDIETKARFRPVYFLHLNSTVLVFGDDLMLHTIYMVILGVFTLFLLFLFFRNIGYPEFNSILFSFASLLGPSAIIWGQFIDAENTGMFFLALSLYFLSLLVKSNKKDTINSIGFIASLVVSSLIKESFLLMIPAVLFLYLWLFGKKNSTTFPESLRKNYLLITLPLLILTASLIYIVAGLGVDSQQYAGVNLKHLTASLGSIIAKKSPSIFLTWFIVVCGMLVLLLDLKRTGKISISSLAGIFKDRFLYPGIFLFLVAMPQFILYNKTGFTAGRYDLPLIIGFSFCAVYFLDLITSDNSVPQILKYSVTGGLIGLLFFELLNNTIPPISKFAETCRATTSLVNSITNRQNDKNLLIVFDPVQNYHEVYSLQTYLNHLGAARKYEYQFMKRDYVHPYFEEFYSDPNKYLEYIKDVKNNFGIVSLRDTISIQDQPQSILILGNLANKFTKANILWFNELSYRKNNYGGYILYTDE